ncbi:pyridine nucleotide-disulfide oxidoreductase-domain-containing protein [Lentinula aciculospora]|uniref:Pyridine nucleotide-disulfide oxidoreductase-domain-containing protein n=1 Tax=Lentinula aciculospora TaxID=153920 RepID=A0A9W9AC16_9AGAR|nr:pyridine nucleotide-disulfide oxidoreductase-domain-containing protein [Lentinula aciculospora]
MVKLSPKILRPRLGPPFSSRTFSQLRSKHLNHGLQLQSCNGLQPRLTHSRRSFTIESNSNRNPSSNTSLPRRAIFSRLFTFSKYTLYLTLSSVVGLVVLTSSIFIHDLFTYTTRHVDHVPINPLALNLERGGPKNLPIARVLVDDDEDEDMHRIARDKPRLVVVGGGWGAMGVLQTLHLGDYHVTVVSNETFTTFTPLLSSAAVGTVQVRSLIEPLRKIVARLRGHFVNGKAIDVDFGQRLIEVECVGNGEKVYIPYDKLVIAVGSTSSTHGVPGLEHCFQLKTIADAQAIRRRVMDNFEAASLPTTSPSERKRLLSFVVCGGGPTGIETAAEIFDFCQEDIINYFPKICREEVSIHYSEAISQYAEDKFKRDGVNLITNSRVAAVTPEHVIFTSKNADGKMEQHTIPTNFTLWSTGIAMNPFAKRVTDLLRNQVHRKAIEVDAHLRVKGTPQGTVYAVGDAATIETSLVSHFVESVEEADKNKDGKIDFGEWEQKIPMAEDHVTKAREIFTMYDTNGDNALELNELVKLLEDLGNKITSLPATAQVASQQGKYIGRKFNKLARWREREEQKVERTQSDTTSTTSSSATSLSKDDVRSRKNIIDIADESICSPFRYFHLGSLAYIGNAAVFDLGKYSFMGGLAAMYAWRSVYWNEQVSMRTRALLMIDWIVRGAWGRDLSRL